MRRKHTPDRIKNKQTHIPFSKFRQPNYIEYNRYGTTTGMLMAKANVEQGASLQKMLEDKNKQNKLYRQKHSQVSYRFGYFKQGENCASVPTEGPATKLETNMSSKILERVFGTEAVRLEKERQTPKKMQILASQSQKEFQLSKLQKDDIKEQYLMGVHPIQLKQKFKEQVGKVNWSINTTDKKQHEPQLYERKSYELQKKAQEDKIKKKLFDLNFRKEIPN